jgi:hypothetical protein
VVVLGFGCWRRRRCFGGSVHDGWGGIVSVSEVVGEGHSSVLEPSDSVCGFIAVVTVALAEPLQDPEAAISGIHFKSVTTHLVVIEKCSNVIIRKAVVCDTRLPASPDPWHER